MRRRRAGGRLCTCTHLCLWAVECQEGLPACYGILDVGHKQAQQRQPTSKALQSAQHSTAVQSSLTAASSVSQAAELAAKTAPALLDLGSKTRQAREGFSGSCRTAASGAFCCPVKPVHSMLVCVSTRQPTTGSEPAPTHLRKQAQCCHAAGHGVQEVRQAVQETWLMLLLEVLLDASTTEPPVSAQPWTTPACSQITVRQTLRKTSFADSA